MAIIHADNFNYFGTTDNTLLEDGIYTSDGNGGSFTCTTDPDTISTPTVLRLSNGAGSTGPILRYPLPGGATTSVGVALRIWLSSLPASTSMFNCPAGISDINNSLISYLKINPSGQLIVTDKNNSQLAITAAPVITAGGWYHIEVKFTQGGAAASACEVRVEGNPVITATDLSFGNNNSPANIFHEVKSDGTGAGRTMYVKDLVYWDTSGSSNNDFLGSVLVYDLTPASDVSFPTGWTSTGANGYGILDNNPPQDGVEYISADDTPPAAAVFSLSDLPSDVTSVRALVTRVRAAKSDGGDGSMKVSLKSGSSVDDGSDRPITVAQTYWSDVSELDPATGTAWTVTSANAAQLEITRTT